MEAAQEDSTVQKQRTNTELSETLSRSEKIGSDRSRPSAAFQSPAAQRRRFQALKSWFTSGAGSVVFHAIVLLLIFLALRSGMGSGTARGTRQTDDVGIVLSDSQKLEQDKKDVLDEDNSRVEERQQNEQEQPDQTSNLENVAQRLLPSNEIGASGETASLTAKLGVVPNASSSAGNDGQTVGFGDVKGSGKKFVYVLDRSDSMRWKGGAPMRRAVTDAIASINSLDPKRGANKFQIIVYNHDVETFDGAEALIDVNPENKSRAIRYLRSLVGTGGTKPENALAKAMKMRPDVVFFLTDADEELTPQTLEQIRDWRRAYKVKQICVVEFGKATDPKKKTFRQLAGENNGVYIFKDVESL